MNRKTPILDPRSSVTPDAIDLKLGTRDYVVGATQHAKITIGPAGAPRQWGEIPCSNVFFTFFIFFVISCAALENTFLGVSPPFCIKRRVPVGIDFLGVSTSRSKNFPLLNPQNMNFRPLSAGQFSAKNALKWGGS